MFINNLKHNSSLLYSSKNFYNNPIFGIGINNFREESKKKNILKKNINLMEIDHLHTHTNCI